MNFELINEMDSHLADQAYRDAIKNTSSFNVRLVNERRLRLPFLDAQTGVAQSIYISTKLTLTTINVNKTIFNQI
jgi:zinc finger protein ubi-d4